MSALHRYAALSLLTLALHADPIRVRQTQGAAQHSLVVRDATGKQIGTGNVQQTSQGGLTTSHVVYTLNDGSIDDETTVFTQAGVFRVVSDHHTQRGPFFSSPIDIAFDAATGIVTTRSPGASEIKQSHKDIPADIANGIVGTILLDVPPGVAPFKLSFLAPVSSGMLIKLNIAPEGEGGFTISGQPRKAAIFRIHPELGGIVSFLAPAIGKQPKDVMVWVLQGNTPTLAREITQLYVGGPMVSIELAGAHFEPLQHATK